MTALDPSSIQRGQIWDVEFDPQVGAELSRKHPAVVMNIPTVGRLPLCIVVPITTGKPSFSQFPWMMPISANTRNGLHHDSFADAFQVKSIATTRLVKLRGMLSQQQLNELAAIIAYCVGYKPPKPPVTPP